MSVTTGKAMNGSKGISLLGNQRDKDMRIPSKKKMDTTLAMNCGFCKTG